MTAIAIGPHQGRKVFTLQSLPPIEESKVGSSRIAKVAGFSLHAGVVAQYRSLLPNEAKAASAMLSNATHRQNAEQR